MNNIITKINVPDSDTSDRIFITSVNYEERSLGIASIFTDKFKFNNCIVFIFDEERKDDVDDNFEKLKTNLESQVPELHKIYSHKDDPYKDIEDFCFEIGKASSDSVVFFDISTMPVKHMLVLLKTLDDFKLWKKIQILYTEPEEYHTDLYLPMSIGVDSFKTSGEFIGNTSSSLPVLLIEFLGYEGDRAKAIFDNIEPDVTRLIIPKPAYRVEWKGETERFNNTLRKIAGTNNEVYASSFESASVINCLDHIEREFPFKEYKWIVVPLGTKPQSLGIYLFWRQNPNLFSILFADPLIDNAAYYPKGIGKKRLLFHNTSYNST